MLVACFVLIGNSYFNVNNIKYISSTFKSITIATIDGKNSTFYTKQTSKEVVERINKECSKK